MMSPKAEPITLNGGGVGVGDDGGGADARPQGQDASLVPRQKINNRNRRFRRRFQHKVVANDADLDAGGGQEPSGRGLALEHARRRRTTACFPSASPICVPKMAVFFKPLI